MKRDSETTLVTDPQQKFILLTQVSLSTFPRLTLWKMLKTVESGCCIYSDLFLQYFYKFENFRA